MTSSDTTPDDERLLVDPPALEELRARIEAFAIDDADCARPFATRLAQEQRWSAAQAERAIAEYRRFLLLAATDLRGARRPSSRASESTLWAGRPPPMG